MFRHLIGQAWIERMDTFDQKNHARLELQFLSIKLTKSCNKIEFRNLNGLSIEELKHITLEIIMVNCVEIIEVERSVRKARSIETVHEIVVCRERYRLQSTRLELDAQTLAESGLTAA